MTAAEAPVRRPLGLAHRSRTQDAMALASSSTVTARATDTAPADASGRATRSGTGTRAVRRSGAETRLATSRIARSLRQLVRSGRTAAATPAPSTAPAAPARPPVPNSAGKRAIVVALAPRHP